MNAGTAALAASLTRARTLLLVVVVASLLAAGGIGVFYVQRRLVRRLIAIGNAMRWLSSGNVNLADPGPRRPRRDRRDGPCARSVPRTPRSNAAAMRTASAPPRRPSMQHAAAIDQIIGEFRGTITGVIRTVADNVVRMEAHCAHAVGSRPRSRRAGARRFGFLRDNFGERADRRRRRRPARRLDPRDQRPGRRKLTASCTAPPRSRDPPTSWSANCRRAPIGSATSSC